MAGHKRPAEEVSVAARPTRTFFAYGYVGTLATILPYPAEVDTGEARLTGELL